MKKIWLLLLPIVLFFVAYFLKHRSTHTHTSSISPKIHPIHPEKRAKDFESYVYDVIVYGSSRLGFPTQMQGGYVSEEDAKKIAAFLATLQGLKPSHPEWVQEGKTLFYGNCTGCHGYDGKGQKGHFPDLTRRPLLGLQK